jgi:hypothetical protein
MELAKFPLPFEDFGRSVAVDSRGDIFVADPGLTEHAMELARGSDRIKLAAAGDYEWIKADKVTLKGADPRQLWRLADSTN